MIKVTITERGQRILRSGGVTRHREAWAAVSVDGLWTFERIEDTGTPWLVQHRDFPGWSITFGTLSKARAGAEAQLGFDIAQALMRAANVPWRQQAARIYVA